MEKCYYAFLFFFNLFFLFFFFFYFYYRGKGRCLRIGHLLFFILLVFGWIFWNPYYKAFMNLIKGFMG